MKKLTSLLAAFCFSILVSAQDKNISGNPVIYNEDFEKGAELFQLNKPSEAIPFFEKVLDSETVNPDIFIFLGVAYYQVGDYAKSLAVCAKGLARENTDHKILAYNAGNSAYSMGNYMRADACYAIAMKEDEKFSPAVLNRANAQLKLDHLEDARENYQLYLNLETELEEEKKERIELLISLLEKEIELRAKQKPELINPDDFIEPQKMEIPEIPEKISEEDSLMQQFTSKVEELPAPEAVAAEDSVAPEIPVVVQNDSGSKESVSEAKVEDEKNAPKLPTQVSASNESKVIGEENAPELPEDLGSQKKLSAEVDAASKTVEAEKSEKLDQENLLKEIPVSEVQSGKESVKNVEKEEKLDESVVNVPLYKNETVRRQPLLEKVEVELKDGVDVPAEKAVNDMNNTDNSAKKNSEDGIHSDQSDEVRAVGEGSKKILIGN